MVTLYMVFLGVGAGFTLVSFLMGEVLNGFDMDFDTDTDFGSGVSPLKPVLIAVFLTVCGGSGLLMMNYIPWPLHLVFSSILGLVTVYPLYQLIVYLTKKHKENAVVDGSDLIGSKAVVIERIPADGLGKITYCVRGTTHSAPARSKNGEVIRQKEQVIIISAQKHVCSVCTESAQCVQGEESPRKCAQDNG